MKNTREAKREEYNERPQWKCDLAILMGKLVGRRDVEFDLPLEQFIEHLLEKEEGKHIKIYRWLCGYFDFPIREEGDGAYYWRSHLRNKLKKIGISTLKNSKEKNET